MTQEEKQLLLKELCARLFYGVKCRFISSKGDIPSTIVKIDVENEAVSHKPDGQSIVYFHWIESGYIKPYLRPMSSMTEKEKDELNNLFNGTFQYFNQGVISASRAWDRNEAVFVGELDCSKLIDWLNAHHFDFRGLIPMGLALEAPEGMYKME